MRLIDWMPSKEDILVSPVVALLGTKDNKSGFLKMPVLIVKCQSYGWNIKL